MKRFGVSPFKLIVHHSINTERSIPADRRVHNVPLDDTLMVVADDFLLLVLALALALGAAPDALLELLATVSCPEISENMNKERVCGEPISMTVYGRDYGGGLDEHLHCWKVGNE
jgi:hypothetical protein